MDLGCAPRSNSGVRSGSLTDSYCGTLWKYLEDGLLGDRCNVVIGSSPIYKLFSWPWMEGDNPPILRGYHLPTMLINHLTGMILSNPIMILDINHCLLDDDDDDDDDDPPIDISTGMILQVGPSSRPRASQGTVGSTASLVRLAPQQQKPGVPYFPLYLQFSKVCQYEVRYKNFPKCLRII